MKRFVIILIILLTGVSGFAQQTKSKTPAKAKTAQTAKPQVPEYDGAYIQTASGKFVEMKISKSASAYHVPNCFTQFWHCPKKWFTVEKNTVNITSFSKVIFKGAAYNDNTITQLELFPIQEIQLGSCNFFHSGGSKIWDTGKAYFSQRTEKGDAILVEFKRKKISDNYFEVIVPAELEKNKIYAFWDGSNYLMFEID